MFVSSILNLMLENRMSYYYKNRLKNIGPATAGSAGPVRAPLGCEGLLLITVPIHEGEARVRGQLAYDNPDVAMV